MNSRTRAISAVGLGGYKEIEMANVRNKREKQTFGEKSIKVFAQEPKSSTQGDVSIRNP